MKKIFVIIVTYNGILWLDKSLASVYNSDIPIELIVIDNGSTDGSIDLVKEMAPNVMLVEANANLGFGKANNIGIKLAMDRDADYIFLLNQDGYLEPKTLRTLVECMVRHPEFGILSPVQLNGSGTKMDPNFQFLMSSGNCPDFVSDCFLNTFKPVYVANFVMAAFWLVSAETIRKIGLFNPIFHHYGEDNDYLRRANFHKIKVGICPHVVGYHDREYRGETDEKKTYMYYIQHLVCLNDVTNSFLVYLAKCSLLFLSSLFAATINGRFLNFKNHCRFYYRLIVRKIPDTVKMRKRISKGEAIGLH